MGPYPVYLVNPVKISGFAQRTEQTWGGQGQRGVNSLFTRVILDEAHEDEQSADQDERAQEDGCPG